MPVDREELQARLRGLFVDELGENVLVLNHGLVALERGGSAADATLVNEMFRAAHSLKGAAHSAGVEALVTLCHLLEDALSRLRDGTLEPETTVLEPLLEAVDALDAAGRRMVAGGEATGSDVSDAGRKLAALVAVAHDPKREAPPATPPEPTPLPAAEPVQEAEPVMIRREGNIRVSPERLDTLLNQSGELLHACRQVDALAGELHAAALEARGSPGSTSDPEGSLKELGARLEGLARDAVGASRLITSLGSGLAHDVREARMVPIANAYEGLERVVRDLARAGDKDVRLELRGGQVEVDRPILEAVSDAVLHLVRNAIDHGIETVGERGAMGKEASGRVAIEAALINDGVSVSVSDDGRGIDFEALRDAARRRGLPIPDDDAGLVEMAFLPGLSTAPFVTQVSGRGVGLDAVRARIESLGGSVTLQGGEAGEGGQPGAGAGCKATLTLPLTLAFVRVLLVGVAGETVAVPSSSVSRLLTVGVDDLRPIGDGTSILVEGRSVALLLLGEVLGFPAGGEPVSPPFTAVLTGVPPHEAALVVEELISEEEAVMKPLGHGIGTVSGVLGATILPTGRVALLLNPATCVRMGMTRRGPRAAPAGEAPEIRDRRRVLLAEDTLTTRALERSILEAAGFEVLVAVDGLDAWQLLEAHGADAIVSDIDMPRMDGLALCEATRRSPRFRDIPFVLVTSLASEEDRRRGVDAGASAYLVKADFDQALLVETLERLL